MILCDLCCDMFDVSCYITQESSEFLIISETCKYFTTTFWEDARAVGLVAASLRQRPRCALSNTYSFHFSLKTMKPFISRSLLLFLPIQHRRVNTAHNSCWTSSFHICTFSPSSTAGGVSAAFTQETRRAFLTTSSRKGSCESCLNRSARVHLGDVQTA